MKKILITGMGVSSCLGSSREEFASGLFSGASGISRHPEAADSFPVKAVGLVRGMSSPVTHESVLPHVLRQLVPAAGAPVQVDGIVFALTWPQEEIVAKAGRNPATSRWIALEHYHPEELLAAAMPAGLLPPSSPQEWISISEACVTGLSVIGLAAQRISVGRWRRALAVVSDLRTSLSDLIRFYQLGALSSRAVAAERASCPFSASRDGFVKSQGAGAVLLEREDCLMPERAPLACVSGYGQTGDAWRLTEGRPDCSGAISAMRQALRSASLAETDVDCISAHGTSTKLNDALETRAIKAVFPNPYDIPVTALKSQIGHANQAAGMLQAIAGTIMLREQRIAPTINYADPDPACDLDYVPNVSRPARIENLLCNGFAFGGLNAALILSNL